VRPLAVYLPAITFLDPCSGNSIFVQPLTSSIALLWSTLGLGARPGGSARVINPGDTRPQGSRCGRLVERIGAPAVRAVDTAGDAVI